MPPKRKFDKEQIEQAAFEIARRQGLDHLSARSVAQSLGSSTSPIYSTFKTMQELEDMVCEYSTQSMLEYQTQDRTGSPLLDLCLGYVLFAIEEKQLFRDMFLNKVELSEHSQEMKIFALDQLMDKMVAREPALKGLGHGKQRAVLEVLWTYIHGLAAQMNIGAVALADEQAIIDQIQSVIDPIIAYQLT